MHSPIASHRYAVPVLDLDAIAAELNRRFTDGGLEAAVAVGSYLLDLFFDGNASAFRNREGHYEQFRELTQRADLAMSYSFMWTAIAVVEQMRSLPPDVAQRLPLAHHRALLTIKDPELKVRTARYAIDHGLSKRELERRVRRVRPDEPKRGRRRMPELERAVRDLATALEHLREADEDDATVTMMRTDTLRAGELLKELDRSLAELGLTARRVRAAFQGLPQAR